MEEEDPASVTDEIEGCREEVRWRVRLCLSLETYPFFSQQNKKITLYKMGFTFS